MERTDSPAGVSNTDVLARLAEVLEQRRDADPETSYVARLYARGLDVMLKKVGEEATETVLAAKGGSRDEIIHEMADLWFHTLVVLTYRGIRPEEVLAELGGRFGVSGLEEKAARRCGGRHPARG
ncbi:MAG TPA: phosphoribosyl-ATP diphosphatase [Gammaproteobacteria bacterium]|nr:phosphoribosyl-ATP diphosphatase [Gammaproteobacteria bacterium]